MNGLSRSGTPVKVLDVLETDGGWLTVDGIGLRLGVKSKTVYQALWRLRGRGLVESRQVELASRSTGPSTATRLTVETRIEWKVK